MERLNKQIRLLEDSIIVYSILGLETNDSIGLLEFLKYRRRNLLLIKKFKFGR